MLNPTSTSTTRVKPSQVGVPLQPDEADLLIALTSQIPMTNHSTVAKVAMMYGLQTLKPELVEKLIREGLAKRTGRPRKAL